MIILEEFIVQANKITDQETHFRLQRRGINLRDGEELKFLTVINAHHILIYKIKKHQLIIYTIKNKNPNNQSKTFKPSKLQKKWCQTTN